MHIADRSFFESVAGSRSILVIAFGGLGDIVHSVPALRSVRRSFPQARLEVLTPSAWAEFLRGIDGVDEVHPYRVRKAGWNYGHLRQFWRLRRRRYELCVNLWGSDHAAVAALASGAKVRLGRQPLETWKRGWRLCHTHVAVYPHLLEPMHAQWTAMLRRLGFSVAPGLELRFDPACFGGLGVEAGWRGRYIHLSPSASEPAKELALAPLIEVAAGLGQRLPDYPLVLSTTDAPRHRQRLEALLAALPRPPLAVFAGRLDARALHCLVQNAALHVSADSGPVHMAVAAGTPSVSWFQQNPYIREYLPPGPPHYAFVTAEPRAAGITGIAPATIIERCVAALRGSASTLEAAAGVAAAASVMSLGPADLAPS